MRLGRRLIVACLLTAATAPLGRAEAAGRWLAGDLHVHTTYSHDSYGPPAELLPPSPGDAYTLGQTVAGQFALARSRGLDYLAITDHNDIRSQSDGGFGFGGVLPIPAYENSLNGHAQMLGARHLYDNGDKGVAAVRRLAAALHGPPDRGIFQANHPIDPRWDYQYSVPVDTVEAWNLPWYYQPPFPAASDNDRALRYWEGWLDRGARVGVTGGSDNHYLGTAAAQGPGQPTTWVYARERSVRGILEGLRAGHTFVAHEPPGYGGPEAFLEADRDGNGTFESMVGDTVAPGARMRIRVLHAPGAFVRVVTDHGKEAFPPVRVSGDSFEHRFRVTPGATWAHAEVYGQDQRDQRASGCFLVRGSDVSTTTTYCTNRVLMLALTSAIYLREAAAPGRARLVGVPAGCAHGPFRVAVRGRSIARAAFFLDGRRLKSRRIDAARLRSGAHRIVARVTFTEASRTKAARLSRRFAVCRRGRRPDEDEESRKSARR